MLSEIFEWKMLLEGGKWEFRFEKRGYLIEIVE